MPELATNALRLASEVDVDVNIGNKTDVAKIVDSMSEHMVDGLDDLTSALANASAAIIASGFTLFAIKFVPRWAMGLFKAIH